ncbi:DUF3857 domain-containing protein [Chitinophaga silvatica]|uniref:DUF3857 domain-containing protein n=1 Tax=Chitinophaga silvatica TaxID=2282649 RepID=A0A3E1YE71_9BACT|nr:DUF3857 domain-containing protein [Chitinophaga silvatica]RFS24826.1 DUF3857 domain-containing protein [Chitinophaga silvatica]
MKKWIFFLTVGICIANITTAQSNNYFQDLWKEQPELHTTTSDAPFTVLNYKVVRDFNVTRKDRSYRCFQYKAIYKSIKVNTRQGADSLHQIMLSFEQNEELVSMRIRAINAKGEVINLDQQVRTIRMPDSRKVIVVRDFGLAPGWEIEYELIMKILYDLSGSDYLQSTTEVENASFQLIAPASYSFKVKPTGGLPPATDSTSNYLRFYTVSARNLAPLVYNELFYFLPQLQRVDFSLDQAIEQKDTVRSSWQHFGQENYIPYVSISKPEYKQLEKELKRWGFLQKPMPLPQLIYQVEQYVKSNYTIVDPVYTKETFDIISILKSKRVEKAGMVRLLSGIYYLLNVQSQILLMSSRDTIPLVPDVVVGEVPKNILLYFPQVQQALAPTEMDSRFPCYPSIWSGITALRCRDTLIGEESKVLTDFITTPVVPYTNSNITLEATLNDWNNPSWEVKQSFGGYPAANIKAAFTNSENNQENKNKILNVLLPFQGGSRRPSAIQLENEKFTNIPLNKPVLLQSTLSTPNLISTTDGQTKLHIGELVGGTMSTALQIPPGDLPIQLSFPYYQEKRINITVPAGLRLTNINEFNTDINDPALGYKIKCTQDGQQLRVFIIEWYKNADITGKSKQSFKAIQQKVSQLQKLDMVFSK